MRIVGIDEAGRGAVLGPLVVCGLLIDEKDEIKLKKLGVKDSKQLTPKKREELAPKIEEIGINIVIIRVPSAKIDANRKRGINLNQIEAIKMAEIINLLEPDKAIVDAPSYNTNKFRDYLFSKIVNKKMKLVSENYADETYPVVSAASIIAKVNRDEAIDELKQKVGEDFGVGYPHDPRTIGFIKRLAEEKHGMLPDYIRHTWDTVERIKNEYNQLRILNFFRKIINKE